MSGFRTELFWHTGFLLHVLWREGIKPCRQRTQLSGGRCLGSPPVAATNFLYGHRQVILSKSTSLHLTASFFSQWVSLPSATWQHSSWIFFWICTNRRLSAQSVEAHGLELNIVVPQQKGIVQEKILTSKKVSQRSGSETRSCKVAYLTPLPGQQ